MYNKVINNFHINVYNSAQLHTVILAWFCRLFEGAIAVLNDK